MKNIKLSLNLLSASIVATLSIMPSHAIETVIEKEAPRSDIEIAVVPLAGAESINPIITNDLKMGGHNVTDNNLPQKPHTSSDVKYDLWQQQGVPYIVVGTSQSDRGNVTLNFEVLDVNSGSSKGTGTVTATNQKDKLRFAGHKVADRIEEILTGKKGDFSGKMAFVVESGSNSKHNQSLWVSDIDGYNPQMLQRVNGTISALNPSANGRSFTYVVQETGYSVVYSADVTGGSPRRIVSYKSNNLGGALSPDGSSVLFSSSIDTRKNQIYIARNGGKPQRLTNDPVGAYYPSWAPDGNSFVYTSDRAGGNKGQIYRYNLATGTEQRLTSGGLSTMARISNDGKKMTYLSGTSQGMVMDLQTGAVSRVNNTGSEEAANVSPSGKHYIYSTGNYVTIASNGKTVNVRPNGIASGRILSPIWLNPDANNSLIR